jgi:hypothetical protein
MGPENAAMLELLAITTLADMLKQKPLELHTKIHQNRIKINQQGILFMPHKKTKSANGLKMHWRFLQLRSTSAFFALLSAKRERVC